jgi:hypothetical protein
MPYQCHDCHISSQWPVLGDCVTKVMSAEYKLTAMSYINTETLGRVKTERTSELKIATIDWTDSVSRSDLTVQYLLSFNDAISVLEVRVIGWGGVMVTGPLKLVPKDSNRGATAGCDQGVYNLFHDPYLGFEGGRLRKPDKDPSGFDPER